MGLIKALLARTLSIGSDGQHRVPLDQVITAMREIGHDLHAGYKETSRGGLAKVP